MRRPFPFVMLALIALLLWADGAAACAVCAAGEDDRSRDSYVISTIVMSGLPLVLIGSLVWYVRRRVRGSSVS